MFARNGVSVQEPQNLHEAAKAGDIEAARKLLNEVTTHIHAYINSLNSWHQSTANVLQLINGPCKMETGPAAGWRFHCSVETLPEKKMYDMFSSCVPPLP